MRRVREGLYEQFRPMAWKGKGLSPLNRIFLVVVLVSLVVAIAESEPTLRELSSPAFRFLNTIFAIIFSGEYVLRLWAMGVSPQFAGFAGKLRYATTIASLIDLAATLALWATLLFGIPAVYGMLLRLFRVLRIMMLTPNSPWAIAMRLLGRSVSKRRMELSLSFFFAGIVLMFAATILFAVEGEAQPETFGSIPRTMWWAMATLTTVGYGDVYPVTVVGKICAGIVAITSIAIVAMPTGIMAAAFSEAFQKLKEDRKKRSSSSSSRRDEPPGR